MNTQQHQSDPHILDRRTLQNDHRALSAILLPGMSVLDIGCGTGAITKGIAEAVGPTGSVVGLDRDRGLIERAWPLSRLLPHLRFETGDATRFEFDRQFDVVTIARTLQWIQDPGEAVSAMAQATRSGGWIVALDYNHALNTWQPDPPPAFAAFYRAFLDWRTTNGWDNHMGHRLPDLFRAAGLIDIETITQNEIADQAAENFLEKTSLWTQVLDKVAPNLQASGFLTEHQLQAAREEYEVWRGQTLRQQTGVVPEFETRD